MQLQNIITNPKIRFGKPIISGTRLTVEEVLGALAGGMSMTEIEQEYGLTHEQIMTALKFAASWSERELVAEYGIAVGR